MASSPSPAVLPDKSILVKFKEGANFICSDFTVKLHGVPLPPGRWIVFQRDTEDELFVQWRLAPLCVDAWAWYGLHVPVKKYGFCIRADPALLTVENLDTGIRDWRVYPDPKNVGVARGTEWGFKVMELGHLQTLLPKFQAKLDCIGLIFYCR